MITLNITGSWDSLVDKLREQYPALTDDDLLYTQGKEKELLGRLQKRLGKTQGEVRALLGKL